MKSMRKQRGLTAISWVFVVAGVALILLFAMKAMPVYMDNYAVKGALQAIHDDESMRSSTKEQIAWALMKRINVNGIGA